MIDHGHLVPTVDRARTLAEARRHGRHVAHLYGGVLERYPQTAVFNTTDIRVLVHVIEDLTRKWKGQHDD